VNEPALLQNDLDPAPVSVFFDIVDGPGGARIESWVDGIVCLRLPLLNKGTAFTLEERRELRIDGLLPTRVATLEEQMARSYRQFSAQQDALARHLFLRGLQERQEVLFHALVKAHLEEMLPIVYTPTVGDAIVSFSANFQIPRGVTINDDNVDRSDDILNAYPLPDIRVLVVTDSSAILGIGDQGINGLGISIGKLTLYTVAGGVSPYHTMPVGLDVGTDSETHRTDPHYLGAGSARLKGEAYLAFVDRFVQAVHRRWPDAIVQWEDLSKDAAFTVLDRYRDIVPSFNDDIQGTGAVALAGLLSACRIKGESLADQVFVLHGAGAGGIGVARAIRDGMVRQGLSHAEATRRVYVVDSRGLLVADRELPDYKRDFARDPSEVAGWGRGGFDLLTTVQKAKATVLIGLSGQAGAFDREIVEALAANTARPVVFPLSNPTKLAEARPADVLAWTHGRALVATGSPFEPVHVAGRVVEIGQGNNAFVFPGLGQGAQLCRASRITDDMVLAAADAVARFTAERHGDTERLYPVVVELPEVSRLVTAAVIEQAVRDGVARADVPTGEPLRAWVEARFWEPRYLPVVRAERPRGAR
jgi:malate dehydrogenase (oxaloacetate-decarboxylating)